MSPANISRTEVSSVAMQFDLERDMPLTAADLDALARSRETTPLPDADYQRWVDLMLKHHRPFHWDNTDSDEPFTL